MCVWRSFYGAYQGYRSPRSRRNSQVRKFCRILPRQSERRCPVSASANNKLMGAMGAGRFNPMPPAQHKFFLRESETDVNRFVAWVWDGTIDVNHPAPGFGPRSPWVVDTKGRP